MKSAHSETHCWQLQTGRKYRMRRLTSKHGQTIGKPFEMFRHSLGFLLTLFGLISRRAKREDTRTYNFHSVSVWV